MQIRKMPPLVPRLIMEMMLIRAWPPGGMINSRCHSECSMYSVAYPELISGFFSKSRNFKWLVKDGVTLWFKQKHGRGGGGGSGQTRKKTWIRHWYWNNAVCWQQFVLLMSLKYNYILYDVTYDYVCVVHLDTRTILCFWVQVYLHNMLVGCI